MPSLYEMLQNAQNGEIHQNFSQQFNLSPEQTEKAIEALMPAFSHGLKRNTADPAGFASFMQALGNGGHSSYLDDPAQAFSPDGIQEGNAILSHLFGDREVSRAVAGHAAQASGVSESILKQMLPALAPMVMGGLFNQMQGTGQSSNAANFGGGGQNPLGQILEQMMGGGGQSAPRGGRKSSGNPLEDLLGQMMGGGKQYSPQPRGRQQSAPIDNPLGKIFEEMLGGGSSKGSRSSPPNQPQSRPQPKMQPRGRSGGGLGDLFGDMFDSGRQTQDDYHNELGSIFEEFLKGKR